LLSWLLERRRPRLHELYLAFAVGDFFLAFAVGWAARYPSHAHAIPSVGAEVLLPAVTALALLQALLEYRKGAYNRKQALAPMKIYHQVVTIPVLGSWTILGAATCWSASPTAGIVHASALSVWVALLAYDQRHPKLAHAPFDYRRMRAEECPWNIDSLTLAAWATRGGASSSSDT
jgi:hypothetical protein